MLQALLRTLCVVPLFVSVAAAQDGSRWYLGAGGGHVHSMDYCGPYFDTDVLACDNTAVGFKAFGGVNLGRYLAIEAGYVDLGKLTSDLLIVGVPLHDETRAGGATLEAIGILPITDRFSLLATAGGIYWTLEQDVTVAGTPVNASTSGLDMVLGLGLQYQFTPHFGLRAAYQYFPNLGKASETGDTDINFYALDAILRF